MREHAEYHNNGRMEKVTDSLKKIFPLYRFGWSFLLAWVFSVFYTQGIEGYTGAVAMPTELQDLPLRIFLLGFPVLFSALTLMATVWLEKRYGSPIHHPRLFWVAPLLMAAGTALLFIQSDASVATMALFAIGSIATGVGSGLMWVMWGEYYAKISQEEVEFLAPISTAVTAILVLLISSMAGWVALTVVAGLPLISGACLYFSWRDAQVQSASSEYSEGLERQVYESNRAYAAERPWAALKLMGRTGFGILTACFFVCVLGTFHLQGANDPAFFQLAIVISILFTTLISLVSSRGPRRVSVKFLFRWMCPLLVIGFAAIILWGGVQGGRLAYIVSLAARFSFCLITQMFFAHYAASGRTTAVQAYGFGWVFVHLGDFFGILSMVFLQPALSAELVAPYQIATVSIVVLITLTMLILNKSDSFSVEDQAHLEAEGEAEAEDGAEGGVGAKPGESVAKRQSVQKNANELDRRIRRLAKEHSLTPREVEVFELLARGRSVPFIRDHLVISRDTAATHVKHIYTKLDVHSRQELIDLTQR